MERKGEGPVLTASAGGSGRLCPLASPPCAVGRVPASGSPRLLRPRAASRARLRDSPSLATAKVPQWMDSSVCEDLGMRSAVSV